MLSVCAGILCQVWFVFPLGAQVQMPVVPDDGDLAFAVVVADDDEPGSSTRDEFTVKSYGSNYVILHYNSLGNVSEYFQIQQVASPIDFGSIRSVAYREGADLTVALSNGSNFQFYISDTQSNTGKNITKVSVGGIGHFQIQTPEGFPFSKLENHFSNLEAAGNGSIPGCDTQCMGGGCGTKSCSRTISILGLTCNIECNEGYFACCGDMILYGCKCIRNTCCNPTK